MGVLYGEHFSHLFDYVSPPKVVEARRYVWQLIIVDFTVGTVEGQIAASNRNAVTVRGEGQTGIYL